MQFNNFQFSAITSFPPRFHQISMCRCPVGCVLSVDPLAHSMRYYNLCVVILFLLLVSRISKCAACGCGGSSSTCIYKGLEAWITPVHEP
ncbi:hypothetical protein K440DRAFT_134406 [Wilcoxina mikolae CBS 423.85]|nr:hypothetical protein K440DRAFT_134406 [Wilcoxina mikolae CBS 423.85]